MRAIFPALFVAYLFVPSAQAKCPPEEELCNLEKSDKIAAQTGPTHNSDMTLPVSCFGEGVLFKSCNYFPAISKDGRHILSIDSEGHALDKELYLRVLDTKSQRTKSHFLVFGFDGESEQEIPRKLSVKTVGRRLRKVNRLIRRYKPEPMVDLQTADGDLQVKIKQKKQYGPGTVTVTHLGKAIWTERFKDPGDVYDVAYSPKHNQLYVSW